MLAGTPRAFRVRHSRELVRCPLGRRIDPSGLSENALDHVHGNPVDPHHLATDISYFTQARMRANCDVGISEIIRSFGVTVP
jgi:hypothetical protein